jgi:type IV pilus assembly protein PilN
MRLDINLATQPYQDARRFWLRWGPSLGLLSLLTLILLYSVVMGWIAARQDRREISSFRAQIAERDRERAKAEATLNLPENRSTRDRSQFLNELFQRKAFSWTKVFEDLERVMPARVHVVSISPALGTENQLEIKLVVAGDSRERGLELVHKMELSQRFEQTHIDQERVQAGQTSGDIVQLEISAQYVPLAGIKGSTP